MTISLETILYILGGIVTLGGAIAVINSWLAPYKTIKKTLLEKADNKDVREIKERLHELENHQDLDHDRLKSVETGNEKICKCILAITDHELTGNSVDKLRKAKDEMQNYLIEK